MLPPVALDKASGGVLAPPLAYPRFHSKHKHSFHPAIQKGQLLFRVEPVLAALQDGEAGSVFFREPLHGLAGHQMVAPSIEDLRVDLPGDGVLPYIAQVRPGQLLPEVRGDLPLFPQRLLRYAGPAHHVQNQTLHVQYRRHKQRPVRRPALKGQHGEIGPDAVGQENDVVILPAGLVVGGRDLGRRLPGELPPVVHPQHVKAGAYGPEAVRLPGAAALAMDI